MLGSCKIAVRCFATSAEAIQLWGSLGELPSSVPARCRSPLTYTITCDVTSLIMANDAVHGARLVGVAAVNRSGDCGELWVDAYVCFGVDPALGLVTRGGPVPTPPPSPK